MKIVFFDSETTSLCPGQICQLAYVTVSEEEIVGKNFFFTCDSMDPGAQAVHGFSLEALRAFSEGRRFFDNLEEIAVDFASCDLAAAHNYNFDYSFLQKEFSRCGKLFVCKNPVCTMRTLTPVLKLPRREGGYKYPRLSELTGYYGVDEASITAICRTVFPGNIGDYHDAAFDAAALFLSMRAAAVCGQLDWGTEAVALLKQSHVTELQPAKIERAV